MKRFFCLCILWVCSLFLWGQATNSGYGDGYNPSYPGDPSMPEPEIPVIRYNLEVRAGEGGYISYNSSSSMLTEGSQIRIGASAYENYKFVHWLQGDSVVSTSSYFYYIMPAKDVVLTAVFEFVPGEYGDDYNPPTPDDPNVVYPSYWVSVSAEPIEGGNPTCSSSSIEIGNMAYANARTADGYSFKGWYHDGNLVSTEPYYQFPMEEQDIHLIAKYEYVPTGPADPSVGGSVATYTLTYSIDGYTYYTKQLTENALIDTIEEPVKKGYTFDGWNNLPERMPAKNLTVYGSFTIKKYNIQFVVDGEVVQDEEINYGSIINGPQIPEREGYIFEWGDKPIVMPDGNVVVSGSYSPIKYTLVYRVDGDEFKRVEYQKGEAVFPEPCPIKEGHTFSGWTGVPETMPSNYVIATGTFSPNTYKLSFVLEDKEFQVDSVEYGTKIFAPEVPTKEGHSFSGWDNIPNRMPASDVVVKGTYKANTYKVVFRIDGILYETEEVMYGAAIPLPLQPIKEGHTFSGWMEIPPTMPGEGITITGTFTANSYKVTYILDGEEFKTDSVVYGTKIPIPDVLAKEGYTFEDWVDVPVAMPAKDVTITGSYTVNKYSLLYIVDSVEYKRQTIEYGSDITQEAEPTKEGHTFSGWSEIPTTMPAKDVTIVGAFTVNNYKVTYMLEGKEFKTDSIAYGTEITIPDAPDKEGYNFIGWGEVPETMPAEDLTISGSYVVNKELKFNLIYIVDEVEYKRVIFSFADTITIENPPIKIGHTFSGWSMVPKTMPLHDVTVIGTFTPNRYQVTYQLDDSTFKTDSVAYGVCIPVPEVPTKEGYTFGGWNDVPESMPAEDVVIMGVYTVNQYTLLYTVDGEEYKKIAIDYGASITPETAPVKEGHTFGGWSEVPETMPANDVTVTGTFTSNTYQVTYMLDGELFKTEQVSYGAAVPTPEVPAKEGYNFSGWGEVPATMPAKDVTLNGTYSINKDKKYNLIYLVDGVEYKRVSVSFADTVLLETDPVKEGYTFSGWSTVPTTMPMNDVTVKGMFVPNCYQVIYILEDKVFQTDSVKFGSPIPMPSVPAKEGHNFSGWMDVPATMPAKDVTLYGSYIVNEDDLYNLVYLVDGVEYKRVVLLLGEPIEVITPPIKEGYTFSGWSEVPEKMPAIDVTITGTFIANRYQVIYVLENEIFKIDSIAYGTEITILDAPSKEGYIFSGWGDVPETMPAEDLIISGSYVVNKDLKFNFIYTVDEVEYKRVIFSFADTITIENPPIKIGHTFSGWSTVPETMPLHDVIVIGTFIPNRYQVTYQLDDSTFKTDSVVYGVSIPIPEVPTKEGYTFGGWNDVPESMPAEDVVIMGVYTVNQYALLYMVDGEEYKKIVIDYGASITPETAPVKEGHTFGGWSEVPKTMPANDVTVAGIFTPNRYQVTYMLDDSTFKTDSVAYGVCIPVPEVPTKEGYTFGGWSDVPESMPAGDVVIKGGYTVNQYTLLYTVDGEEYKKITIDYGASITPETAPVKEGHTFGGWSAVPETMPANDVTVAGIFTPNRYQVTYQLDDATFKTDSVAYGVCIPVPEVPTKEGYTFGGWSDVPESMPAGDVVVMGGYTVNQYTLLYTVDGEEYKKITIDYGASITPETAPVKEGHTFGGWSAVPETMPANDVTVAGIFTPNRYQVTYQLDDATFKTDSLVYGVNIPLPEVPTKEGYTFGGWNDVPESMPAGDVVVMGGYTVNQYTLLYTVDGEEYKKIAVDYGASITPETAPVKEGHTFGGWSAVPETMPANDVTIIGVFTANCYEVRFLLDGEVFHSETVVFGTVIPTPMVSNREGYTFGGWADVPTLMPAMDMVITGTFTANGYKVIYMLEDEVFKIETVVYGAKIPAPEVPAKEGYTFCGWGDVPVVMPAQDITLSGIYTVSEDNKYCVTYLVDGVEYRRVLVLAGEPIEPIAVPTKDGHTFSGWSEIPATMPANDVTITGTFTVNGYQVVYILDGLIFKTKTVLYGEKIPTLEVPAKDGYNFSGWNDAPNTMPAQDIMVHGIYTASKDNKYYVIYLLDGIEYERIPVLSGEPIELIMAPTKEGHSFSGWSYAPTTMPTKDVTVRGYYAVNQYSLSYTVDGVEYKTMMINYGAPIEVEVEPTKEGYTFSGWSDTPAIMPAKDVTIIGTFAVNSYIVTYLLDGKVFKTDTITYGSAIPVPEVPVKDIHIFSGWEEVPETMPARDIIVSGTYIVNKECKYYVIYMVDGVEYKRVQYGYDEVLTLIPAPAKEGYTFSGWVLPEIFQIGDVMITGSFIANKYNVIYMVDGMEYKRVLYTYGDSIIVEEEPIKKFYTFSGWSEVPETMPANDVVVKGSFMAKELVDVYTPQGVIVKQRVPLGSLSEMLENGVYVVKGKKLLIRKK